MINPYSLLNQFFPEQAVQAITGIVQPKTPEENNSSGLIESRIRADIDSGKLPATITEIPRIREERIGIVRIRRLGEPDNRPIIQHPYTEKVIRIARADLLTWCEQNGIPSPLLFPDQDEDPRKRASLLKLTLALCLKAFGNPGCRGLAPKIAEYAQQQGISLGEDTIRKYLKELDNLKTKTD
ncbi:MAG: hypothetical protein LAE24_00265 [Candidatus Contendobacter sp.]|nr:hypothetical protein [Candidatus Contendobacter sp.]